MAANNLERVLRLMAEKNASDVYMSANTPILIKIHGQMLQLSDQLLTQHQTRQLLSEMLAPAAVGRAGRYRRAERRHQRAARRQFPAVGLQAARLDLGGDPLHPVRDSVAGHAGRAAAAVAAGD